MNLLLVRLIIKLYRIFRYIINQLTNAILNEFTEKEGR